MSQVLCGHTAWVWDRRVISGCIAAHHLILLASLWFSVPSLSLKTKQSKKTKKQTKLSLHTFLTVEWIQMVHFCIEKKIISHFFPTFYLFCFVSWGRVLCSPGYPGPHVVDQAGLKLRSCTCLCITTPALSLLSILKHSLRSWIYFYFTCMSVCGRKRVFDPLGLEL